MTDEFYLNIKRTTYISIFLAIIAFSYFGYKYYPGSKLAYISFSVISNYLLYLSINSKALFFELFIASFIWLGFWLKFTVRIVFFEGVFIDPVGLFDHSPWQIDKGIWLATLAILAIVTAIHARKSVFNNYQECKKRRLNQATIEIYSKFRRPIFTLFMLLVIFVASTNFYYGVYQKGTITQTILPLGLNSVYKWLLIFGFSTLSAIIIDLELQIKKDLSFAAMFISMLESFSSNVSMLSRGMVMNSASIIYGVFASANTNKIKISKKKYVFFAATFLILFLASIQIVNSMRATLFHDQPQSTKHLPEKVEKNYIKLAMFTDRWVGIEGVLAVSSYNDLGWRLLKDALNEKYDEHEMSFYDKNLLKDTPYSKTDRSKHHFMSLPGYIAFLFYPGSYLFLFAGVFSVSIFSALLEYLAFRLSGGNMVFTALIAQTVAYRFTNFGYVPSQSYLLFGAILLTCSLIYMSRKLLQLNLSAK